MTLAGGHCVCIRNVRLLKNFNFFLLSSESSRTLLIHNPEVAFDNLPIYSKSYQNKIFKKSKFLFAKS